MATRSKSPTGISKSPTRIPGLDAMTEGGLPKGAVTLVVGTAGAGKTVLALQTLAGAAQQGEPGIFVAFEEPATRILANAASFGWGLPALMRRRMLLIDARLPQEAVQSGDFEITGLLENIGARAKSMKARWVVFDAIDVLFDLLPDVNLRRREIHRLQGWLQSNGLTCVLTAKTEALVPGSAPAHAYLAYMSECVIQLARTRSADVETHWLAIEKYRGSSHSDMAVPYLIGSGGIELNPMLTHTGLHRVYHQRISTGIPRLDAMLGGGLLRGSATLLTGSPGTAKTTLAGMVAETACRRGERVLYICFDESAEEIERNLTSVGIRLAAHRRAGRLVMLGLTSRARSGEAQHAEILRQILKLRPRVVVIDPLSALLKQGLHTAAMDIAYRLVQDCKVRGITLFATGLAGKTVPDNESSDLNVSALADSWLHLSYLVRSGERNRLLTIVKSRGSAHSNQVRELVLDASGITLADVYVEEGEVLTGTLRYQREAAAERKRVQAAELRVSERAKKEQAAAGIAEHIRAQQVELDSVTRELALDERSGHRADAREVAHRSQTSTLRRADRPAPRKGRK
jgi:circadian clock protein KaiC